MGIGFKKGSGLDLLNFEITAYSTEAAMLAADPVENTIGVVPKQEMTGWVLAAVAPEAAEGLVWIRTGSASVSPFNALRRNSLMVYPGSAAQYVSGVWENIPAKIYQNGTWKNWTLWLVQDGKAQHTITPVSKASVENTSVGASAVVAEAENGVLQIQFSPGNGGYGTSVVCFFPKMDFTGHTKLSLKGYYAGFVLNPSAITLGLWTATGSTMIHDSRVAISESLTSGETTVTIDLSGVEEKEGYVGIAITSSWQGNVFISDLRAE